MNVKAGVAVLILKHRKFCRDKEVLIGRRKGSHGSGLLAFPGGHIEFGESFEDVAVRETFEETGLIVEPFYADGFGCDLFSSCKMLAKGHHYVTTYVTTKYIDGEPELKEPDKCEEWFWVNFHQLQTMLTKEDKVWIPYERLKHHLSLLLDWPDDLR